MRLAQTTASVNKERIVGLARIAGHSHGRRMHELIGLTHDEAVERILGIEHDVLLRHDGSGLEVLGERSRGGLNGLRMLGNDAILEELGKVAGREHGDLADRRIDLHGRLGDGFEVLAGDDAQPHLGGTDHDQLSVDDVDRGQALKPDLKADQIHAGLHTAQYLFPKFLQISAHNNPLHGKYLKNPSNPLKNDRRQPGKCVKMNIAEHPSDVL